ncbi:hypothetical protein L1887_02356 [Cichorium endivia]|nr:hypothetical protein L1887_02356 [Cichorium endivia]
MVLPSPSFSSTFDQHAHSVSASSTNGDGVHPSPSTALHFQSLLPSSTTGYSKFYAISGALLKTMLGGIEAMCMGDARFSGSRGKEGM